MRLPHVILSTFLIASIFQGFFWQHVSFLDQDDWVSAAEQLYYRDPAVTQNPTFGYRGAPPLLLAGIIHYFFNLPFAAAYPGSLASKQMRT